MAATLEDVERAVRIMAEVGVRKERYFSDLDAVVGDGDFGFSLARGFEQVLLQWEDLDRRNLGAFLKQIALLTVKHVGGTSGPLWGTGFLRAGNYAGERLEVAPEELVGMLRAAIAGIMERGKANLGDKTFLDALVPAVDVGEAAIGDGLATGEVLERVAATARRQAEATRDLMALRGRAAYTGERSRGALDAGAVAVAVMLEEIASAWSLQDSRDQDGSTDEEVHQRP